MASSNTEAFDNMKKDLRKSQYAAENILDESEEILPLNIMHLTAALIDQAQTELNETDEVKEKCIFELRKLLANEKILVTDPEEGYLLAYLRARKYNVKKAFKLIQSSLAYFKEKRNVYGEINVGSVIKLIFRDFIGCLMHRDQKGCAIIIFKYSQWNPQLDSYEDLVQVISYILIFCLLYPATQIAGFRVIFDFRDISWAQMKYATPSNICLLIRGTQFCFPGRFKGVHVVSSNKAFKILWAIAYPFLTSKLKKRILFHDNDLSPILEHIHPSVLPKEFGGEAEMFNNSKWGKLFAEEVDKVIGFTHYAKI